MTTDSCAIEGVSLTALSPHADMRGSLCEFHRDSWGLSPRPLQWDYIASQARVLRGVHVHRIRHDLITVLRGRAAIGLSDLRRDSPSFGRGTLIEMDGGRPAMLVIPPGVAHGVFARTAIDYLYGLTAYYDGLDQAGCRFDDPGLGIAWPDAEPVLLPRDAALPSRAELIAAYERGP